jgi:hypothetical protein
MIAGYEAGDRLEAIGRRHAVSLTAVRTRLLAENVRLRPPGRRPVARIVSRPAARAGAVAARRTDGSGRPSLGAPGADGMRTKEQPRGS